VCKVCGAPRSPKAGTSALCETHLRAQRREINRRYLQRRAEKANEPPERPPVASERALVRVTGRRVEMDLDTLRKLLLSMTAPETPAPAPAPAPAECHRLAVVANDLGSARLYTAQPGDVVVLLEASYGRQVGELRAAGWTICVAE
jgi:hypothetical protein